jgi:molybdopterin synthase sulfur carrier subunit
MRLVYFARVREAIGLDGEQRDVTLGTSVAALIDELAAQSSRHADAFADRSKLRFAVDQKMVREDALLDGAEELAIFPPVTGG